jgi:NADH-quinone oxidoreductase subunit E
MPYSAELLAEADAIVALYGDHPRSAVMPLLHLTQSVDLRVTPEALEFIAERLDMTTAEVTGVASFYTMYKRKVSGKHHVGVCVNSLCGLLGGDAIWKSMSEDLGVGHDQTTADGEFTIERIECQAACTHAPVMTVDWEFMDQMTPEKAREMLADLRAGNEVRSTRGPVITDWAHSEHVLAGFDDGLADEGPAADSLMLAGLEAYKRSQGQEG